MTDAQTIAYYSGIAQRPESWQRADWGSPAGQQARLDVLVEELANRTRRAATVLDVGCGDGRLGVLLPEDVQYTGWDLVPVQVLRAQESGLEAEVHDLMTATSARWEWVVASGLWTYRPLSWAQEALARMFALCTRGVIVNSLSRVGRGETPGELALAPCDFLAWGFALTPAVALRHDYWPGDMTLILTR